MQNLRVYGEGVESERSRKRVRFATSRDDYVPDPDCFLTFRNSFNNLPLDQTIIGWFKSRKVGPITKEPVIPFPQEDLYRFEASSHRNYLPEVKIQCGRNLSFLQSCFILKIFRSHPDKRLHNWMERMYNVEAAMPDVYEMRDGRQVLCEKDCIPHFVRTMSIKKTGFKHGELCHEFEPINGMAPGSYFEYQMFGDNRIQATYYMENGRKYIAGFCIYINSYSTVGSHYNNDVARRLWDSEGYHVRRNDGIVVDSSSEDDQESDSLISEDHIGEDDDQKNRVVRYCKKSKRHMISRLENRFVVHEEWNSKIKKTEKKPCETCTKDNSRDMDLPPDYDTLDIV